MQIIHSSDTLTVLSCCRLVARMPWQPITDANKMLPTVGGYDAGSTVLELYILMGATLHYRLEAATAANEGHASTKEPLPASDGPATIAEAGDGGVVVAASLAKDGAAEP